MSVLLLTMGPNLSIMADIPAVGVGNPGVIRFRATGASGPVKWTLVDSTLPAEWDSALNPDGNAVTLTTADAETAGTFSVTVRAVDNARIPVVRSFDVRVTAFPLVISGAFPEWEVGVPATGALTINGGVPPYSGLAITAGALPDGVSLSIVGNQIVPSGTPTLEGEWYATIQVSDSASVPASIAVSGDVVVPVWEPEIVGALSISGPGSSPFNLTKPSGTSAGDLLLATVWMYFPETTTFTPPAGWSLVASASLGGGSGFLARVYSKIAGASEPSSYAFTYAGSRHRSGSIVTLRNVGGVGVVGTFSASGSAPSAPGISAPSITIPYDSPVMAFYAWQGSGGADRGNVADFDELGFSNSLHSAAAVFGRVDQPAGVTGDKHLAASGISRANACGILIQVARP